MTNNEHEYFEKMLDARFENINQKIDQVIHLQKIANGRTTKNEENINDLKQWRAESRGHWKAASIIGSIIGAVIGVVSAYILKN